MDQITLKRRLQPNATCEGALHRLLTVKKELDLNKKEEKILSTARQYMCRNQTFQRLKELTEMTKSGTFAPLSILSTVRHNFPELYELSRAKRIKALAVQREGEISGEKKKRQIEKDLKMQESNFPSALNYLYLINKSIPLTGKQMKILHSAIKGQKKSTYIRLKTLTKIDKSGKYSPFAVKKALNEYREELGLLAKGIRVDSEMICASGDKKKLPVDTNYKYPTKTSVSIWTVRKK